MNARFCPQIALIGRNKHDTCQGARWSNTLLQPNLWSDEPISWISTRCGF